MLLNARSKLEQNINEGCDSEALLAKDPQYFERVHKKYIRRFLVMYWCDKNNIHSIRKKTVPLSENATQ